MHPPFLFWSCQKRNGPCTVQREKTLRRVGPHGCGPPAAGGGWLAIPCGSQGRKRPALGGVQARGCTGIPPASLSAAAHASAKDQAAPSGAEGAERGADQMRSCTPTNLAPSATGRQSQESQKRIACPKTRPNRSRHRYADPRRAEGNCTGARPSRLFFWTVHGPFSFPQDGKENGGCIPAGQAPCGSKCPLSTAGRLPKSDDSATLDPR